MTPRKATEPEATEPAQDPSAAQAPASPERPTQVAKAWEPVAAQQRGVRAGLLTLAIVMLGVGCVTAFYAAMRIASIWFERQYVPIAQLVVAGIVIAACVRAIRGLNRR